MRLRNKKTGVIGEVGYISTSTGDILVSNIHDQEEWYHYKSLAGLNAEWEDAPEEPKKYWFINSGGETVSYYEDDEEPEDTNACKEIGNYFETKEEAEKVVRKLKAIRRLSKCSFRFEGYTDRDRANGGDIIIYAHVDIPNNNLLEEAQPAMLNDLDLLFGGEA